MKHEDYYKLFMEYLNTMDDSDRTAILERDCYWHDASSLSAGNRILCKILDSMRNDIATDAARSAKRSGELSAIKSILKRAKGIVDFETAIDFDGKMSVSDGYCLIRLNEAIPGLEVRPASESAYNIITRTMNKLETRENEYPAPSLEELKLAMNTWKAEKKAAGYGTRSKSMPMFVYDAGPEWPLVNGEFLANMLQALPGCKVFCGANRLISPLYFSAENGDGVLCPVRRNYQTFAA